VPDQKHPTLLDEHVVKVTYGQSVIALEECKLLHHQENLPYQQAQKHAPDNVIQIIFLSVLWEKVIH
jgi:hypothetical protein